MLCLLSSHYTYKLEKFLQTKISKTEAAEKKRQRYNEAITAENQSLLLPIN
jgi:hypothetical protein